VKFLTFATPEEPHAPRPGILLDEIVIDLPAAFAWVQAQDGRPSEKPPESLFDLINAGSPALESTRQMVQGLVGGDLSYQQAVQEYPFKWRLVDILLHPPLPRPMSIRDFYAFEQHVATARAIRGKTIPPEWYQFPVFYFSNPNAIYGPGELIPYPAYTRKLDYELEIACIIGRPGINIRVEEAGDYIFGYTLLNDWTARDIQSIEMEVGLGPAKGKDFATSLGPWIVTPEELSDRQSGEPGVYDLAMTARLNGLERSRGNWNAIHYSFAEMIAHASAETWLLPGDVLGSGTVGTGCLLEITKGEGPWLQPGDLVELEIERLGVLENRIGRRREI
jgi:fumarylacetoacetate (FAA) hydrolase